MNNLRTTHFAFLTLKDYSFIALINAVEPLRMANKMCGDESYRWSIASLDGLPVAASNGLTIAPTVAVADLARVDILFVCGGVNVRASVSPRLLTILKRLAGKGVGMGAVCTGGYALAHAGLLDQYRATIHWENLSALREEFPHVQLNDQVFTVDRDRYTCSGGIAPLDMMLNLIRSKHGPRIAEQISEQFILDRVRDDNDRQYVPLRAQLGASHVRLMKIAQLMEENIEKPLSLDAIARSTRLSRRQVERLFKRHLGCVPKRYYLSARLRRARELLLQTAMRIDEITTACGFQSPPHFSKCYRKQYGHPPSAERRRPGAAGQNPVVHKQAARDARA
jgi:transcriptional regulator GlxA family with amidase domain